MPFIIAIVLLVIVSLLLHFLTPWYLTPIASNWENIDDTINITFWVTGCVFVAVNLFMAYAVYRFRYSKERRAKYEPENKKLETWLTLATSIGVAAMLAPGLFVWADFVQVPEEAHEVEALGQQWQWSFRYPGADGVLGAADAGYITPENPFGMSEDDPAGRDDILVSSQEMHLPLDRPVNMLLRSKDVLHDYAVAPFRVKMDLVPGSVTYMWLTPTAAGTYDILCEELCGLGHHVMRGKVVVEDQAAYDAWLATQPTFAQTQQQVVGDAAQGQAMYAVCAACHGANGEGNVTLNAPRLAGQEDWYLRRQLNYFKAGVRGSHPQDVYGAQMRPMASTLATDAMVANVAAYIESLPATPAQDTITGDVDNGRKLFEPTCGVCHSARGEGIWAVNAPKLAGMNDWYLARQLQNFKTGVRGTHADDEYGFQMTSMVQALADDQAINDVVAYINTLE
ncbi:MAG: c-type cytochrome [Gammaproteobacteria bacterium]